MRANTPVPDWIVVVKVTDAVVVIGTPVAREVGFTDWIVGPDVPPPVTGRQPTRTSSEATLNAVGLASLPPSARILEPSSTLHPRTQSVFPRQYKYPSRPHNPRGDGPRRQRITTRHSACCADLPADGTA